MIALLKSLKLTISSSIYVPKVTSLNKNQDRHASIKKNRKTNPTTFISFGIE